LNIVRVNCNIFKVGAPDALAVANTPDALNCYQYREFWISWLDGYIRIGTGSRYRWNELIRMPDRKPHPISAVSFSTANGVLGEFEVESDSGTNLNKYRWCSLFFIDL